MLKNCDIYIPEAPASALYAYIWVRRLSERPIKNSIIRPQIYDTLIEGYFSGGSDNLGVINPYHNLDLPSVHRRCFLIIIKHEELILHDSQLRDMEGKV